MLMQVHVSIDFNEWWLVTNAWYQVSLPKQLTVIDFNTNEESAENYLYTTKLSLNQP